MNSVGSVLPIYDVNQDKGMQFSVTCCMGFAATLLHGGSLLSGKIMLLTNTGLIIVFVAGVIFSIIGFGFRDRNPGLALLGLGFLAVLFAFINKAYDIFG